MTARHVSTEIERPAGEVAAFIRHYPNLPRWAAGLASGIEEQGGVWFTESPMGRVAVAFVAANPFGVCDHEVTLPDTGVVTNPLRVIDDGPRCQVVFTVRGDDVAADARAVETDLATLKALLEGPSGGSVDRDG